jgi:hypothetical protein
MSQLTTHRVDPLASSPRSPGNVVEKNFIRVVFQSGFPQEVGINGCRIEDVLSLAVERLEEYQRGPLACPENQDALDGLYAAIGSLEDRLKRRREQGVLNTMSKHETFRTEDLDHDFSATGA